MAVIHPYEKIIRRHARLPPIGGNLVRAPDSIQPGVRVPVIDILQRARGLTSLFLVTNQSLRALPIDFDRRYLLIVNNDAVGIISAFWGLPGAYGKGIVINANGGFYEPANNCPTAQLFLIGSIAINNNVSITLA
jgi:hypothetical protein